MDLKYIDSLDIPERATKAEGCIIDTINLLDGILNEAEIVTDDIDGISDLCGKITKAYNEAKGALNELQQEK